MSRRRRRKPFSESHQTFIACSATLVLIAGAICFVAYAFPVKPVSQASASRHPIGTSAERPSLPKTPTPPAETPQRSAR